MKAIITGASGQQGSYLMEFLLQKGYDVHGFIREEEYQKTIFDDNANLYGCEMTDDVKIFKLIEQIKPDEIYNLAAMNSIAKSVEQPMMTMDINYGGLVRIVKAVESAKPSCKIYHACSSEIFGEPVEYPQTECTKPNPRNPYGISKCAGLQYTKLMRGAGMRIYCGILYNNDSPRRTEEFLSRKVCKYVASVLKGNRDRLRLGNLDAQRDFGYSKEYAEWTWRIVQHETPTDFIMATGVTHTIREFVAEAFSNIGIADWQKYIQVDKEFYRPSETLPLVGDASRSKKLLNFSPKTTFKELVSIMMQEEIKNS